MTKGKHEMETAHSARMENSFLSCFTLRHKTIHTACKMRQNMCCVSNL